MIERGDAIASGRLSRRRFLAASAALAAAGSVAAIAGCDRSKNKKSSVAGLSAKPPASLVAVSTRGGVLRVFNFDALQPDSLDPHLTQFGPIANMHSAVYSKLLRYDDERAGTIVPDLAAAMPEQPDEKTYIFTLRDGIRFHDTPKFRLLYPKTAGRALTATDVRDSIARQLNAGSAQSRRFFRSSDWNVIDNMEVRDTRTLVITTKTPVAPFLSFLAGRHAQIIPVEVLDHDGQIASDAQVIGSGSFMLDSFEQGVAVRLRRNPAWFARDDRAGDIGNGRPFLDGYDAFLSPQEDAFQRAAFERRLVDATGFLDPATLDSERKTNLADISAEETDAGGFLACRLLLDRAPFKDDRARRALHLAIDRGALIDLLYAASDGRPSAKLSGPIAPVMDRWSITQDDLRRRPGYRYDAQGRAADIAQAKQLWSAALGEGAAELKILFAGAPKIIPDRAVDAVKRQLRDALGANVTAQVDASGQVILGTALTRNLGSATDGVVSFSFALDDGGVDLDDWLFTQFRSGQSQNTYRLQDPQLDAMLDKSRAEFDVDARRKIGLDAQDYLLAKVNARLEICAPVTRRVAWGYVRNPHIPIWYGNDEPLADTWLDTAHPAWRGRGG